MTQREMVMRDTPASVRRLVTVHFRDRHLSKVEAFLLRRRRLLWEVLTSEKRSSTDHRKDTRRNCGNPLANQTAKEGAGVQSRNDDPRRDFATESHYCEDELDKGAIYQPANIFWRRTIGLVLANPGASRTAAILKKILDDFIARLPSHWIGILK